MKKLILLFILINTLFLNAQNSSFYKMSLDSIIEGWETNNVFLKKIVSSQNKQSFLLLGTSPNYNEINRQEPLLFNMNSDGNINYGKVFRSDKLLDDLQSNATFTSDNKILFTTIYDSYYGVLLKLDSIGKLIWAKKYDSCVIKSIAINQNNYYLAGFTSSGSLIGKKTDFFIIKTDTLGNIIWSKAFGGGGIEGLYNIYILKDGSIMCIGYSKTIVSPDGSRTDSYIIKLDTAGNVQWAKVFDYIDQGATWAERLIEMPDSSIVLYVKPQKTLFYQSLMKIDYNGNVKWAKEYYTDFYNLTYSGGNLIGLSNGDILSTAYIFNTDKDTRPLLLKTDSSGEVIWQKQYNNVVDSVRYGFQDLAMDIDSNLIFVGEAYKEYDGVTYLYHNIIKSDPTGLGCATTTPIKTWTLDRQVLVTDLDTVTDINVNVSNFQVEVFDIDTKFRDVCVITGVEEKLIVNSKELIVTPNPAIACVQIELLTNAGSLQIIDLNGKVVLTKDIKQLNETIDVSNFPQGVYFVRVVTRYTVYNGRFVKM